MALLDPVLVPETPAGRPAVPGAGGAVGLLERIGNTPLLDLSALLGSVGSNGSAARSVHLYAKAEMANPGGSVKDRPALAMVLDAERRGLLEGGRRILDATSGNTGIAYAMIGAARGHGVTLALPANASPERKQVLAAYGAQVIETDPLEGSDGAIREARRLAAEEPHRWAYLDQYSNPMNPRAHTETTGPEILRQTRASGGELTHFVTGLGTSGTFIGVGRYLAEAAPRVRRISVQPDAAFHGLEGMKHMASAIVPAIYDPALADEDRSVSTETAHATCRRLARELGLLVGVSAGANVAAALEVAEALDPLGGGVVVTILCDGADKYLSESFWNERGVHQ